ncbi:MAG TPA: hypothetical protein VFP80_05335 [Thermoanaerobaculia bacterium]|nr:hypothetical protein [Thermoanaerobaculia bacterium]
MAKTSSSKGWINVRDKSKFILTTSAVPANVDIAVVITTDTGTTTTWDSSDVLNKTKTLVLRSPRVYEMAVTMRFAGAKTTLKFDARIEKPDGSPHGKPFRFEVTPPPKTHHADITIVTKKES